MVRVTTRERLRCRCFFICIRLQCSWTSSLELSSDGPQTTGLVIQLLQTVAEDLVSRSTANAIMPD